MRSHATQHSGRQLTDAMCDVLWMKWGTCKGTYDDPVALWVRPCIHPYVIPLMEETEQSKQINPRHALQVPLRPFTVRHGTAAAAIQGRSGSRLRGSEHNLTHDPEEAGGRIHSVIVIVIVMVCSLSYPSLLTLGSWPLGSRVNRGRPEQFLTSRTHTIPRIDRHQQVRQWINPGLWRLVLFSAAAPPWSIQPALSKQKEVTVLLQAREMHLLAPSCPTTSSTGQKALSQLVSLNRTGFF